MKPHTSGDMLLSSTSRSGRWLPAILRWLSGSPSANGRGALSREEHLSLSLAALEAAPNPVIITDARGTIEWVNPAFSASSGYSFDEAIGQNPRLLKSGRQTDSYYADMWRTIQAGRNWHGKFINRRKNGEVYIEEVTIAPIRDVSNTIRHFVAIKLDVTAREEAEEARQRLATIIENTTDLVGQADAEGRITYVNAAGLRLLGFDSLQEITGRPITEYHTPESAARIVNEGIPTALRSGSWAGETELRARDGRLIPVSQVIIFNRVAGGTAAYLSTIMRDLTERRQTEARLHEQAEVIDKSPIAIVITNLSHRVTYCNEGALRLYGLARKELLGRTADELFTAETMQSLGAGRTATLATGQWAGEVPVVTNAGRRVQAEFHMCLIRDSAGQPKARLSVAIDVTEKKKIEEQFLHAQRLEGLGMLAAGIAHDLNNILTPVLIGAPVLRSRTTEPDALGLLKTIEKSAERGASLVKQILSFAHDTRGERTLIQVRSALRDIAELVRPTLPKSIQLECSLADDLGAVIGNQTQLQQILLNLCVNARDAMPEGGTLSLRAERRTLDEARAQAIPDAKAGTYLVLEVADTGTGIPPEILPRIWDPFFTTKSKGSGTGLGLATVRGIVASHCGFAAVESAPGQGTTFRIYLPEAEESAAIDHMSGSAHPFLTRGRGELVLIVDDESAVTDLAQALLTKNGYRVLVANSGMEAIFFFAGQVAEINLVVTDLRMPEMDGEKLARELSRLNPKVKILYMSGTESAVPLAGRVIKKPFSSEELLASVHEMIEESRESC